jgi:hypothetical protein
MPTPSNIVLTPNSSLDTALPITVNVSANDIFERPDWTYRELFTQQGDDAPLSGWNGGALQSDGIIGKSFKGNGVSSYIDKNISWPATTFIGFSMWLKLEDLNTPKLIYMTRGSYLDGVTEIRVSINTGKLQFFCSEIASSPTISTKYRIDKIAPTLQVGEWFNFSAYYDITINEMKLFFNGVEQTTVESVNPTLLTMLLVAVYLLTLQ